MYVFHNILTFSYIFFECIRAGSAVKRTAPGWAGNANWRAGEVEDLRTGAKPGGDQEDCTVAPAAQ